MSTKRAVVDKVSEADAGQTSVFALGGSPCAHGSLDGAPTASTRAIRFQRRRLWCPECEEEFVVTRADQKCVCGYDPFDY